MRGTHTPPPTPPASPRSIAPSWRMPCHARNPAMGPRRVTSPLQSVQPLTRFLAISGYDTDNHRSAPPIRCPLPALTTLHTRLASAQYSKGAGRLASLLFLEVCMSLFSLCVCVSVLLLLLLPPACLSAGWAAWMNECTPYTVRVNPAPSRQPIVPSSTIPQALLLLVSSQLKKQKGGGQGQTGGTRCWLQRDGPIPDGSGNLCRPFGAIITNHHSSL